MSGRISNPDFSVAENATLSNLPDHARLWAFGASRPLAGDQAARLVELTARFIDGWAAHGEALAAAFEWRHDRFLLVAVDEGLVGASGCSIDALVRHVRALEKELDVQLVDASPIWYRDAGEIRCVSRAAFRDIAARGEADERTVVFNLTVERLGELRDGSWELPASASWHARLLPANR